MFYCLILLASTVLNRSGKEVCLLPNSKEKTSIFTSKYDKYFDLQFFLVNERFFPEWVFNVYLDNYFVCFFFHMYHTDGLFWIQNICIPGSNTLSCGVFFVYCISLQTFLLW